jgi:SPOR domain
VARFFFGAAVGGRLRLRDIPDWGYWNPKSIAYWDEAHIDGVSRLALLGRKIRSAAELDDAIAASLDLPGIQALWIHDSVLPETRRRWKASRSTVRNRLETRLPAAAAAVVVGACLAGWALTAQTPAQRVQNVAPQAVQRGNEPVRQAAPPGVALEVPRRRAVTPARAYAVTLGTFTSAARADRLKHVAQSKGYIVRVVSLGAFSQVVTRPYANRAQAERIARGLLAAGLPARLTSWEGF